MNIKQFRIQQGLTQAELASALDLTQGAISHYESGRRELDKRMADRLIAYADSIGIRLTYNDVFSDETSDEAAA